VRAWTDRPFEPVVELGDLRARLGPKLVGENGQSLGIFEVLGHPGWLFKRLKPGFLEDPDILDRLIALPGRMNPRDLDLVDAATCWPVSRVVDAAVSVGVVFAAAPGEFFATLDTPFGQPERIPLSLDQLVQRDESFYADRGWPPPTRLERLRVTRNILRIGVLLERHDVVYGDWSYANCLWARDSGRVFLIDMDSCGLSARGWLESNSWDDPAVRSGERLTVTTDRYKLAVTALRVLTGIRGDDPRPAYEALSERVRTGALGTALLASITEQPRLRPTSTELLELIDTELADQVRPSRPAPIPRPAAAAKAPPAPVPAKQPVHVVVPDREDQGPGYERIVMLAVVVCLAALVLLGLGGLVGSLIP
jgi:hypothetical protein